MFKWADKKGGEKYKPDIPPKCDESCLNGSELFQPCSISVVLLDGVDLEGASVFPDRHLLVVGVRQVEEEPLVVTQTIGVSRGQHGGQGEQGY